MNMTAETSTYIYGGGAEETVTLSRGPLIPAGHALLKIAYSDGRRADCYVDLAWLRDRADHLARQRPEGAEELAPIVDEFLESYWRGDIDGADATDWLAERGVRVTGGN